MIVFSTFALAGCAFLVYACFHWLREELDLKRPAHRDRSSKKTLPAPYVIRAPRHGHF
jgi:threonine/homoserine/homoserine lactone efflux protein